MIKPAFSIPSMSEVEATPKNGLNVISLFSGCGGSSLGYRMAGYNILLANEFMPAAQEVYELNKSPDTILDKADIRKVNAESLLMQTGLQKGELDLLDGSPPCSSFSVSGNREKDWGEVKHYSDTNQRTDDLFIEFIRLVNGVQPKVFVAENVYGLIMGTSKGMFIEFIQRMKACGYRVKAVLLDSQWLGVPQTRKRIFFVGVRNDLKKEPVFPKPLPYKYSIREAFGGQDEIRDDTLADTWYSIQDENGVRADPRLLPMHRAQSLYDIWRRCPVGGHDLRRFNFIRCDPELPSPTITAEGCRGAGPAHGLEPRRFTISELKRICSFPDDFQLTGTFEKQWERLGRSVPPLMMEKLSGTIRDNILT